MNHEATRQHRRRTCSCSRLEALAARRRREQRQARDQASTFTASLRKALGRAGL